ncbi:MAG: membrane complex biogenesis BtpA family protein [Hyphomicrobiaceae bacterium]|jgi:membrane complex biogenesis BtpA family protein
MRTPRPLLGVVHLGALPSAARHQSMSAVLAAALADADTFAEAGFDGLVIENFGDAPFRRGTIDDPVTPDVPAAIAVAADRIKTSTGLPVAINCLRNDGIAALGVAAAVSAQWVRVNVLTGAYVTDQGIIAGESARLAAYRRQLRLETTLLADFMVKHAKPMVDFDLATGARDLAERSGADGMVLSGSRTGQPVDVALFDAVRDAVGAYPIWIGSGLDPDNAKELWPRCDGAIVGTWCKQDGKSSNPVDAGRAAILRASCPAG